MSLVKEYRFLVLRNTASIPFCKKIVFSIKSKFNLLEFMANWKFLEYFIHTNSLLIYLLTVLMFSKKLRSTIALLLQITDHLKGCVCVCVGVSGKFGQVRGGGGGGGVTLWPALSFVCCIEFTLASLHFLPIFL